MRLPEKSVYMGIALLALLAFIALVAMTAASQRVFTLGSAFTAGNPLAVFFAFAALAFGGAYFLKAGAQIIKGLMK